MQEVLRMYPPVGIGQVRIAEKHDIVLGGKLHLPAGTIMWVSVGPSISALSLLANMYSN